MNFSYLKFILRVFRFSITNIKLFSFVHLFEYYFFACNLQNNIDIKTKIFVELYYSLKYISNRKSRCIV